MAGYVLKITIENTHPPVWRRVVIPEKITFEKLHEVIQILFGWEDAHLHDFQYPKDYFEVVSSEEDHSWGELHLETETMLDPYLQQYPWIRYTYDFGDCWEHRIVLEKEMQDFQERHAVLLKLKGDHFMEDSGGCFGAGDYERIPAEATEINARLEQLELPFFESKPGMRLLKEPEPGAMTMEEQLYGALMESFEKYLEDCTEEERMDVFRAILNEAGHTFGQKMVHASKASRRLDDWNTDTQSQACQGNSIRLIFQKTPEKMADLLMDWHRVNLEDYCKYLGISYPKKASKKKLAEYVADACREHPKYLQLFMTEPELLLLKKYLDALAKNVPCEYDDETDRQTIVKAVCIGLFRLETLGKQRLIYVASDAAALVNAVFAADWKAYYNEIAEFDRALGAALIPYGMIDFGNFQKNCERIMGASMDQEEFLRIVYWHGRMNQMFETGSRSDTGEDFVLLPKLDMELVKRIEACADQTLGYKTFSDEELEGWKEGFFNAIPAWMEYSDLLIMLTGEDRQLVYEWMSDDYTTLSSGISVTEFLEELYETFSEELTPELAVGLWETVMFLAVHMPLAGLKGYSRAEYAKMTGKSLEELALFDENGLDRRVNKQTMLHQLPAKLQLELFEAHGNEDMEVYIACLDRMLRKYKNNEAIWTARALTQSEHLLMHNPGMVEDMMMYEELFGSSGANIYPWDEDALEAMRPEIPTFVREQPKIGRNDPCPCGSGKKYKKCCGRS